MQFRALFYILRSYYKTFAPSTLPTDSELAVASQVISRTMITIQTSNFVQFNIISLLDQVKEHKFSYDIPLLILCNWVLFWLQMPQVPSSWLNDEQSMQFIFFKIPLRQYAVSIIAEGCKKMLKFLHQTQMFDCNISFNRMSLHFILETDVALLESYFSSRSLDRY